MTLVLMLIGQAATAAAAERLAMTPLAGLPSARATTAVFEWHGEIVAVQGTRLLSLSPGASSWAPLAPRGELGDAVVTAAVSSGDDAAALLSQDGQVRSVLFLHGNDVHAVSAFEAVLPIPLQTARVAWEGRALLVAGLAADGSPRLFSQDAGTAGVWRRLEAWPPGSSLVGFGAQDGGRFISLSDGTQWRWTLSKGWLRGEKAPGPVLAGFPHSIGQAHLLYGVARGTDSDLYSYSAITDAWARLGELPHGAWSGSALVDRRLVLVGADDGIPYALGLDSTSPPRRLALVDQAIVVVYMLAMLGVGLYFYRRTNSGDSSEFFLGSRSIPYWAAGLSMFAGTIGSVAYLAIPAKAFATDWQYLMSKVTYVGALVVVALWLAPFLRNLNIVSIYSYLENRFHVSIRLLSSALWIIMQLTARMAVILYLPSLAINTMTGIEIVPCILVVGVFTIVYTALGGMRAVVWTDVVQALILTAGAIFTIAYVVVVLGFQNVVDTTLAFDKTRTLNLSFDLKQPTLWALLALAILDGVLCFPKDQIVMQRVLSTSSTKEATWSILTFAAVLLPSAVLFYAIGTVLFAFYRAHPTGLDPLLPIDAVFPIFIGSQLPIGVAGLVVAGILAAAMGTLSGIINSVATLLSVDFYDRFLPRRSQRQIVRFSEIASVAVGMVGIGMAILLSRLNVHSLLDLTIELGGVIGGSFGGVYPLGIFSTRSNWQGAAIGIVVSAGVTFCAWFGGLLHPYLYLPLAVFISMAVGYLASLLFPPPEQDLEGLTIFTRRKAARP